MTKLWPSALVIVLQLPVFIVLAQEPDETVAADDAAIELPTPPATEPQPPVADPVPAPPPAARPALDTDTETDTEVGESVLMSADELAALGLDTESPGVDRQLRISGFVDVGFGTLVGSENSYWRASGAAPPRSTFFVGNLNLYLSEELMPWLRIAAEVRFSYLPNGSSAFGLQPRVSTVAYDYTDYGRSTRWGAIIPQRVYVELSPHSLVSFRVGQFLTPYGIWNVDHGSPVFIPVRRPWCIGVGWIPERQTGIEIHGRTSLSPMVAGGYHLTVSNGTGPVSEYADLDENKAIGGRLFLEFEAVGRLRIGGSAYYGRETDALNRASIGADGAFLSREILQTQFDSLTWAGDLLWEFSGLHVQTEFITNQRAYTDSGRVALRTLANNLIIPSDYFSWGGYGLLGYRFAWLGVMPFVMLERVIGDIEFRRLRSWSFQAGLNVRPAEMLVFKATYEHVWFAGDNTSEPLRVIMTQIATAF